VDNGAHVSQGFQADCEKKGSKADVCAVGSHWQSKWPGTITEEFWPFAVRYACTFHNSSIFPHVYWFQGTMVLG